MTADRGVMTVRLDRELRRRLGVASRRNALTLSAAVRQALEAWIEREQDRARAAPYEAMADLVGCVAGPTDLSRAFTSITARRRGSR